MKKAFNALIERGQASPKTFFLLIFIALLVSDLLLVRDFSWLAENSGGKRFWVNFSLSALVLFFLMMLLTPVKNSVLRYIFLLFILSTQVAQQSYFAVYRNFFSVFDLRFASADPLLALTLWLENAIILKPLLLLSVEIPLLLLLFRLGLQPRIWQRVAGSVFAVVLFFLISFNWYGINKFQFSSVAYAGVLPNLIERNTFEGQLQNKPAVPEQIASDSAPNIVFIVGESLTLEHLSIYNYPRETTPHLKKMLQQGEMVLFHNAVTTGTRTLSAVPYMLTGLQGIDPHGMIYRTPTIFNYAKAAGYRTAFITAQDFQWRNIDQIFIDEDLDLYQNGTDFSASVSVSTGADDIKVLEQGVLPYLDTALSAQQDKPLLLVTQMNGSHYPYNTHSPDYIKKFLPESEPNGNNAYDNTVVYTDHYLKRLIDAVRSKDSEAWVFYSSDHGQDVSDNATFFNSGYSSGVIHNAMMIFPPASAQKVLQNNALVPVSQADIFATILALMEIKPVSEINGEDLRNSIHKDRLRVVSAYMKTLHNEPNAVLVFPDLTYIYIDFDRHSATLRDGKTVVPYTDLAPEYRQIFDRRLTPNI